MRYPRSIARPLVVRPPLVLPARVAATYAALVLLALVLPFEAIVPVLTTPWFSLSDDKLVLVLAALAWLQLGPLALPTRPERRALAPSLLLAGVATVSALLAPAFAEESLKSVWRLVAAAFALLLTLRVAHEPSRVSAVLWAVTIGAGASAVLGLAEASGQPAFEPLLRLFKTAPTRIGPDLRVSASFQYATIASMYFEMVAPLALVQVASARRGWQRMLALAIALVCTANVVLSLTRAGILTLALVYAVLLAVGWLWRTQYRWRLVAPTLAASSLLLAGVAILTLRDPVFDMRLISESDADWYAAAYTAPATLQLQPDARVTVGVNVRNDGRIVWSSSNSAHPFGLGYRWLTADGSGVLDLPPGEVALPHEVRPGETIHLEAAVDAAQLPSGQYRLEWGMLQRDVVQFYERGSADAESLVTVSQPADGRVPTTPAISPRDESQAAWVVGRLQLWQAALRLVHTRPLLGVGPDNFRHLYGAQLGLETWDERVQANNLYLELLVDTGVLGLAAFAWVVVAALAGALRSLRSPVETPSSVWLLACSLGALAFLVHGVLDSFLAFTPTAVLFWMLLAIVANLSRMTTAETAASQNPHVSGR